VIAALRSAVVERQETRMAATAGNA